MKVKRNYKIVNIEVEAVVALFNGIRFVGDKKVTVQLPIIQGLPKGYEVHKCQYSFERDCFQLLVWHQSFPETPEGQVIPELQPEGIQCITGKIV